MMYDPSMDVQTLKAVKQKFDQGVGKLHLLERCLGQLGSDQRLDVLVEPVNETLGELTFWFAGTRYYVRVRITDRETDDVGVDYRVPIGWLDWGRHNARGQVEPPEQSNFYDQRGILCEMEKDEFYCSFEDCGDNRVASGLTKKLERLVGRTIALNNGVSP